LQEARLQAMADAGVNTVTTNADRPSVIRWYKMSFGYREVGTLAKLHSFGHPDIDHWTTLELDLDAYIQEQQDSVSTNA
jgi:ribosomal-protein-alanine N-acetyltransferase